jgi:hypothetical protein
VLLNRIRIRIRIIVGKYGILKERIRVHLIDVLYIVTLYDNVLTILAFGAAHTQALTQTADNLKPADILESHGSHIGFENLNDSGLNSLLDSTHFWFSFTIVPLLNGFYYSTVRTRYRNRSHLYTLSYSG